MVQVRLQTDFVPGPKACAQALGVLQDRVEELGSPQRRRLVGGRREETVEELTQSLLPLVGENGMDWMYANTSTTAQRGALDWRHRFRETTLPLFQELYRSVESGDEARVVIDACAQDDYRAQLDSELKEMRQSELWRAGAALRRLRPLTTE